MVGSSEHFAGKAVLGWQGTHLFLGVSESDGHFENFAFYLFFQFQELVKFSVVSARGRDRLGSFCFSRVEPLGGATFAEPSGVPRLDDAV